MNLQNADNDAVKSIRSSVSVIERTLYKLMLDFSEHVQVGLYISPLSVALRPSYGVCVCGLHLGHKL